MNTAPPVLACRDLRVVLGSRRVLDGVSATFAPREVTAIVGPNGAGKSTWLSVLAGLRRPHAGGVSLGETALHALRPRVRAQRLALLPQTPEVAWAIDVETLVGLGRLPHVGGRGMAAADRAAIAASLAACGLRAFAKRAVTTLSGGERARAMIARALSGEPQWLLADEPLTGLDPGHALDAASLFRGFAAAGGGVILTLHDLAFAARWADRVIVLGPSGRILSDGAPLDAMSPAVLETAYGVTAAWRDENSAAASLQITGRSGR